MSWLKGCEICNTGLINRIDELVEKGQISLNKACKLMEKEGEKQIGDLVYSASALRSRYRYHKGLRDPNPKVGQNDQLSLPNDTEKVGQINQPTMEILDEEEILPDDTELSAEHYIESAKASAKANQRKKSDLEKIALTIKQAARGLYRIIECDVNDNCTDLDGLFAQAIRRHGPSIIISYYQIGIDPEGVIDFYKGGNQNAQKAIVERNI